MDRHLSEGDAGSGVRMSCSTSRGGSCISRPASIDVALRFQVRISRAVQLTCLSPTVQDVCRAGVQRVFRIIVDGAASDWPLRNFAPPRDRGNGRDLSRPHPRDRGVSEGRRPQAPQAGARRESRVRGDVPGRGPPDGDTPALEHRTSVRRWFGGRRLLLLDGAAARGGLAGRREAGARVRGIAARSRALHRGQRALGPSPRPRAEGARRPAARHRPSRRLAVEHLRHLRRRGEGPRLRDRQDDGSDDADPRGHAQGEDQVHVPRAVPRPPRRSTERRLLGGDRPVGAHRREKAVLRPQRLRAHGPDRRRRRPRANEPRARLSARARAHRPPGIAARPRRALPDSGGDAGGHRALRPRGQARHVLEGARPLDERALRRQGGCLGSGGGEGRGLRGAHPRGLRRAAAHRSCEHGQLQSSAGSRRPSGELPGDRPCGERPGDHRPWRLAHGHGGGAGGPGARGLGSPDAGGRRRDARPRGRIGRVGAQRRLRRSGLHSPAGVPDSPGVHGYDKPSRHGGPPLAPTTLVVPATGSAVAPPPSASATASADGASGAPPGRKSIAGAGRTQASSPAAAPPPSTAPATSKPPKWDLDSPVLPQ